MTTLHALLVGIDNYHPETNVPELSGCLNDVNSMSKFLTENYAGLKPQIVKLTNEEATRKQIIQSFHSHLIRNANKGDTVVFYYSGHGSTEKTPSYFKSTGNEKQNETLVCYDSRQNGHYDLVDKEIAVLLSRIRPEVNIVVISDSCHSGSITRSISNEVNLGKVKHIRRTDYKTERGIDTYILTSWRYVLSGHV